MEKLSKNNNVPTIDLSVFFRDGDEEAKKAVKEKVGRACTEYGCFMAKNHGISAELMSRAMQLCREFFDLEDEEKLKCSPIAAGPAWRIPAGYTKHPAHSPDKNEHLLMLAPQSGLNVLPNSPPGFKDAVEELFENFTKTGELILSILTDYMDFPPNFLKEFNQDRSWDWMNIKRYFPATEPDSVGISSHKDGNAITFVFQDDVGGLELLKDGRYIPIPPSPGTLVCNLGDIFQVLTNEKITSPLHRVVSPKGSSRYSFSFFYNMGGDKWIEPLPQFTTEIGEPPKYKGFMFKEYQALRIRNKTHPPYGESVDITHYAI
ncbi:hypothetical protein MIMGU_mgv1a023206mg [Erythranthe guttata]|uniref:Fe2OG dioxygenase domain-containing protein n=1 Tax=Erythranthe guttata TaxID=4155 RepID=A0A022R5J2_ERYGU|nr:PREDICTED: 1-aminocyclopropane-1-carboxylate oxidase 1-like [Erythranthe guttata]EYU35842.1 hypothetical protein MIMGU_mgv1a023206mg [Erythranthe guttata]|eukprot:XP_012839268.1 PREDICTED: 1-aminocyclopropane-1-carboxylate oxidase 1-like [Erythranthe guttata]